MAAKLGVEFEAAIGRYMTVEIQGRANRIYFETAGQGMPLVCLTYTIQTIHQQALVN